MRHHDHGTGRGWWRDLNAQWSDRGNQPYTACVAEYRHAEQQRTDRDQIDVLLNQTGTSMFSSTTRPSNR